LDECAMLAANAWYEVCAPMLLDNGGDAWFLSTPRRRNWFYDLYQRAVKDDPANGGRGRWEKFHATSFDNPHLSQEDLEEIKEDLNDDGYKQEILAIFLEGEGAVFRNITACLTADPNPDPDAHRDHWVVMGGDWAQVKDYTTFSVGCQTCMTELFIDRFNQMTWAFMRNRVVNAYRFWHVKKALLEENSVGKPNIELLRDGEDGDTGINVEGFDTQASRKAQLVRSFQLALERQQVKLIKNDLWTAELEGFQATVSRITGHTSYAAEKDMHDDTVIARMLMWKAMSEGIDAGGPSARTFGEIAASAARDDVSVQSFATAVGYNTAMPKPPGTPWGLLG
jgi:hypothetical protein